MHVCMVPVVQTTETCLVDAKACGAAWDEREGEGFHLWQIVPLSEILSASGAQGKGDKKKDDKKKDDKKAWRNTSCLL